MKRAVMLNGIMAPLFLLGGCANPFGARGGNADNHTSGVTANQATGISQQITPKAVVLQLKSLAQSGKVDNSSFVSGKSTIGEVEQAWGQPNTNNAAGEGTYATYSAKQAAFGYNQSGIIFDVRSYSKRVQQLTAANVKNALGAPNTINHLTNQINEIYQVNDTYQIQFIIDTKTNRVDHISVYDPQAVAAQTTPLTSTTSSTTPIRGVIEGFYGAPWTEQERINMFHFMKTQQMNTYVYAPKDDPYQRAKWGVRYPAAQFKQMKTLVENANANGVRFVYSISPGIPAPLPGQSLTQQMIDQSITYSSAADKQKLEQKINQMESIGVHTFMLSFDDIETMLKPADQKVYGNQYAKAQMQLANQILRDERKRDPQFKLWFAPTSYYGLIDGPYWQTMRSTLDPSIQAIWTGKWVINKTITTAQAEEITQLYGRKPILWDNYPVNDYTYDVNQSHQLMMGPVQGRDATLLQHVAGYISNPMLQPDASQLALQTIADYLQHPSTYQPLAAWDEAVKQMPGITNPGLFKTFAEYTSTSELNPSGYAPIGSMISAYWNASSASQKQQAENTLRAQLQLLASLPQKLPPTITDKELLSEIQPWLTKLGEEGQGGIDALAQINQPSTAHEQALEAQLNKVKHSPYQIGSDIISFMQKAADR
ncbi:beta-N-acetylglucosaminidase domain-containing protein [Alicyclobacillus fodiniaquatilis]|uniref:Beta-N-acetylglucosaminidase domain-containing protein n=1 Tax=Alicyclobacillus fodiniaquatilis TaxID=1661150 RepID=A0ABW4JIU8_9BACL